MSINSEMIRAVTPIVPICVPEIYSGEEKEYCTFTYTELPICFGDNAPQALRYLVTLNWFLPWTDAKGRAVNPLKKKRQIKNVLMGAGFTYPGVVCISDAGGQGYVFECEYLDGDI